jgi:hypothetical protein
MICRNTYIQHIDCPTIYADFNIAKKLWNFKINRKFSDILQPRTQYTHTHYSHKHQKTRGYCVDFFAEFVEFDVQFAKSFFELVQFFCHVVKLIVHCGSQF